LFQFIRDGQAIMFGLPPPQPEILSGSMEHAHHPYILLGRRVNSRWFKGVADLSGRGIFSWNVTETLEKRRQRDAALSHFLGRLQDIGLGTMKIYASETSGYVMKAITDDLYLYGLTAVFPWAIQMLTDIRPNCTMLDATFRILRPYILEILNVIIANELIPIGIAVFPSETQDSSEFLYSHIEQILVQAQVDNPSILSELPLVSDQGSGLRAFVNQRGLNWKHCHRHLIEAAGAHSQVGDWVARLLQCSSQDQYERVRACIQVEISYIESIREESLKAGRILNSPKFHTLFMMLHPDQADLMHTIDHWAKWLRLGCPSTSNASESIHAKLNAVAGQGRTFLARLSVVRKFLFHRFAQRNSVERIRRRSSNRFLARRTSPEHALLTLKPGHEQFLWSLNTIVGNEGPVPDWLFPDFPSLDQFQTTYEIQQIPLLPPDSWKIELLAQLPQNPIAQHLAEMDRLDLDSAQLMINEGTNHNSLDQQAEESPDLNDAQLTELDQMMASLKEEEQQVKKRPTLEALSAKHPAELYDQIGWGIILSIRRLIGQEQWQTKWKDVLGLVFTIGGEMQPAMANRPSEEAEASWRITVLTKLELL
jgi:hypothetical protein